MSNHTPGPWGIAPAGLSVENDVRDKSGVLICKCYWPDESSNARLIAESPEMYQIVQRLATCDWMSEKELSMWARKSREIMERINK
jgi:hypothetical protein